MLKLFIRYIKYSFQISANVNISNPEGVYNRIYSRTGSRSVVVMLSICLVSAHEVTACVVTSKLKFESPVGRDHY
jgi:hypothetical protein